MKIPNKIKSEGMLEKKLMCDIKNLCATLKIEKKHISKLENLWGEIISREPIYGKINRKIILDEGGSILYEETLDQFNSNEIKFSYQSTESGKIVKESYNLQSK